MPWAARWKLTPPFRRHFTGRLCIVRCARSWRIASVSCGSVWAQTFNYDPFGNITKSGSVSWMPGYNESNNHYLLGGTSYDADGNLLNDTFHTYTWDAEGKMVSIDSTTLAYDALERMVEQNQSGTYYQVVYTPMGKKLGMFKGQTIQEVYVPLPGGDAAEYLSWGLSHYRHADWLGSDRLEASTGRSIVDNNAYAPFGEPYAHPGNGEISFTGQNSNTVWPQYDFLYRQYQPQQSRWISPDPAGLAAADPTTPQSWNRYAYVMNNPLAYIDPDGTTCDQTDQSGCGDGTGDGGTGDAFRFHKDVWVPLPWIVIPILVMNAGPDTVGNSSNSSGGGGTIDSPANGCAVPNPPIPCANACPPVPPHPGYASVNANMKAAAAAPFALYSFYNLVRNHGPWDYKQAKNLNDFGGIVPQSPFEDFGNFNYGATAASLGVPLGVALRGAGYAGVKSVTGSTWDAIKASLGPPPYGDDPPDQAMINQGYAFSKQGCHE